MTTNESGVPFSRTLGGYDAAEAARVITELRSKAAAQENALAKADAEIRRLERKIHEILTEQMSQMQSVGFSCNERQKSILLLTKSILEKADLSLQAELLSEQFRLALHNISHLVGEINNEDILGEIFASFCIGK
jgi:tRNA modification GTPase